MVQQARDALAACGSLADALRVGRELTPAWAVVDVVIQDEFTHDVIFEAGAGGPALVLDCT